MEGTNIGYILLAFLAALPFVLAKAINNADKRDKK
jgi:hypothetical protein